MHDLILAEQPQTAQLSIKPIYDSQPVIVVVSDDPILATPLEVVCDFLSVSVEHVSSSDDLMAVLEAERPMAVITEVDCRDQDGFNVMMTVSRYDPDLPIMVLTGDDPVLIGASEAIEDVFGLTAVARSAKTPRIGVLVDFLFTASRKTGCLRLLPL
jgi:CheY-like chemotaxis protein